LIAQIRSPQIRHKVRTILAKARTLSKAANRLLAQAKAEKNKDPLKALKLVVQARAKMKQAKADAIKARKIAAHAAHRR
jgi:hypothetical protein